MTDQSSGRVPDVEVAWSQARPVLVGFVMRRGLSREDAEDVAQEVGFRLVRERIAFRDVDDLLRWCQVVARRIVIDEVRRAARRRSVPLEGEHLAVVDVAEGVHTTLELRATLQALGRLSPGERDSLVAVVNEAAAPATRPEQLRQASARARARTSLRRTVGYPWVVAGPLAAAVTSLRRARATAFALPVATVAVTLSLWQPSTTAPLAPQDPPGGRAARPASAVHPVQAVLAAPRAPSPAPARSTGPVAAARGTRETRPHEVLSATGPAGVGDTLSREQAPADAPVLCVEGDLTGGMCLDVPGRAGDVVLVA